MDRMIRTYSIFKTVIVRLILLLGLPLGVLSCGPAVENSVPLSYLKSKAGDYSEPEYRIQPGDDLDIKFYYTPELDSLSAVRPDGRISLPLLGDVMAAGRTPNELTQSLIAQYSSELKTPEITVFVRTFAAQQVFVDGEVKSPGVTPLATDTTALQAIFSSGGFTDRAREEQVVLIRRRPDKEPLVVMLNMKNVLNGNDLEQDVALLPSDIIYVPKKPIIFVNIWVDQYIRQNTIRFANPYWSGSFP